MISIDRQLRNFHLLLESKKHTYDFKYKDEVNLSFYLVDGGKVRNNDEAEFIGGGHHLVYKWMPDNEVWLEETFPKDERVFFSMHELLEYLTMKYDKYSYDKSHDIANHYEGLLRQNPDHYKAIIKSYVDDDFNDKEDLKDVIIEFWEKINGND